MRPGLSERLRGHFNDPTSITPKRYTSPAFSALHWATSNRHALTCELQQELLKELTDEDLERYRLSGSILVFSPAATCPFPRLSCAPLIDRILLLASPRSIRTQLLSSSQSDIRHMCIYFTSAYDAFSSSRALPDAKSPPSCLTPPVRCLTNGCLDLRMP